VPLEVTIRPNQWTRNLVPLRRVSTPTIQRVQTKRFVADGVDNGYGNLTGGEVVVIDGSGFRPTSFLACKFQSTGSAETHKAEVADRRYAYTGGASGVRYDKARYVNASRIECTQPRFAKPSAGRATVEVTLDGTIYSNSNKRY